MSLYLPQSKTDDILMISEQWWPEGSGGILASYLVTNILKEAGFKLTIIHGTKQPKTLKDVSYVYTDYLRTRNKHTLWLNCLLLAKEDWFLNLIRESNLVYIPRLCYPLIPIAKKLGKKVVIHLHDYQPISYTSIIFSGTSNNTLSFYADPIKFEILEKRSILRALVASTAPINSLCRLWLKDADTIICVSRRQAEIISHKAPELAHKLAVAYNPLPKTPPIGKNADNMAFLYLGGDSYVKGFHILLEGSQKLLKKGLRAKFMLTRKYRNSSRRMISKLGDNYDLLGHISHDEVLKFYSQSLALLFPSIWEEPLPYAVNEAMLTGTIPIASRVGGVPEITEGTYAEKMMFTPGDSEEMVDKMEEVLSSSPEKLNEVGCKLREDVMKKFNDEIVKQQLLRIFGV